MILEKKEDHDFFNYCIDLYRKSVSKDIVASKDLDKYLRFVSVIQNTDGFSFGNIKDELLYTKNFENQKLIPFLSKEDKIRFKDVKSIVKYVNLKIQGECLGRVLGKFRTDCYTAIAENLDYETIVNFSEKKVVVFSSYIETSKAAVKRLEDLCFKPLSVYGEFTKNLSSIVKEFETNENANPLVATYASLSTGVPLIMANTCIMINMPFRDYIYQQAIGRVWRLGMTVPVYIYNCELDTGDKPNISTRGFDILKWTAEQAEIVTGMRSGLGESIKIDGDNINISNESYGFNQEIKLVIERKELDIKHLNISNW